jgi:apolipoprotein D and lipocalin family protein
MATECGPFEKKFSVKDYLGLWYEIARLPTFFQSGDRNTATYTATVQPNVVNVYNVAYNKDWKLIDNIIGKASPSADQPAALTVTFPPPVPPPSGVNYIVHDTDYDLYSMVGDCNRQYLWILCRNKTMSAELYCKLVKKAKKLGYDTGALIEDYKAVKE